MSNKPIYQHTPRNLDGVDINPTALEEAQVLNRFSRALNNERRILANNPHTQIAKPSHMMTNWEKNVENPFWNFASSAVNDFATAWNASELNELRDYRQSLNDNAPDLMRSYLDAMQQGKPMNPADLDKTYRIGTATYTGRDLLDELYRREVLLSEKFTDDGRSRAFGSDSWANPFVAEDVNRQQRMITENLNGGEEGWFDRARAILATEGGLGATMGNALGSSAVAVTAGTGATLLAPVTGGGSYVALAGTLAGAYASGRGVASADRYASIKEDPTRGVAIDRETFDRLNREQNINTAINTGVQFTELATMKLLAGGSKVGGALAKAVGKAGAVKIAKEALENSFKARLAIGTSAVAGLAGLEGATEAYQEFRSTEAMNPHSNATFLGGLLGTEEWSPETEHRIKTAFGEGVVAGGAMAGGASTLGAFNSDMAKKGYENLKSLSQAGLEKGKGFVDKVREQTKEYEAKNGSTLEDINERAEVATLPARLKTAETNKVTDEELTNIESPKYDPLVYAQRRLNSLKDTKNPLTEEQIDADVANMSTVLDKMEERIETLKVSIDEDLAKRDDSLVDSIKAKRQEYDNLVAKSEAYSEMFNEYLDKTDGDNLNTLNEAVATATSPHLQPQDKEQAEQEVLASAHKLFSKPSSGKLYSSAPVEYLQELADKYDDAKLKQDLQVFKSLSDVFQMLDDDRNKAKATNIKDTSLQIYQKGGENFKSLNRYASDLNRIYSSGLSESAKVKQMDSLMSQIYSWRDTQQSKSDAINQALEYAKKPLKNVSEKQKFIPEFIIRLKPEKGSSEYVHLTPETSAEITKLLKEVPEGTDVLTHVRNLQSLIYNLSRDKTLKAEKGVAFKQGTPKFTQLLQVALGNTESEVKGSTALERLNNAFNITFNEVQAEAIEAYAILKDRYQLTEIQRKPQSEKAKERLTGYTQAETLSKEIAKELDSISKVAETLSKAFTSANFNVKEEVLKLDEHVRDNVAGLDDSITQANEGWENSPVSTDVVTPQAESTATQPEKNQRSVSGWDEDDWNGFDGEYYDSYGSTDKTDKVKSFTKASDITSDYVLVSKSNGEGTYTTIDADRLFDNTDVLSNPQSKQIFKEFLQELLKDPDNTVQLNNKNSYETVTAFKNAFEEYAEYRAIEAFRNELLKTGKTPTKREVYDAWQSAKERELGGYISHPPELYFPAIAAYADFKRSRQALEQIVHAPEGDRVEDVKDVSTSDVEDTTSTATEPEAEPTQTNTEESTQTATEEEPTQGSNDQVAKEPVKQEEKKPSEENKAQEDKAEKKQVKAGKTKQDEPKQEDDSKRGIIEQITDTVKKVTDGISQVVANAVGDTSDVTGTIKKAVKKVTNYVTPSKVAKKRASTIGEALEEVEGLYYETKKSRKAITKDEFIKQIKDILGSAVDADTGAKLFKGLRVKKSMLPSPRGKPNNVNRKTLTLNGLYDAISVYKTAPAYETLTLGKQQLQLNRELNISNVQRLQEEQVKNQPTEDGDGVSVQGINEGTPEAEEAPENAVKGILDDATIDPKEQTPFKTLRMFNTPIVGKEVVATQEDALLSVTQQAYLGTKEDPIDNFANLLTSHMKEGKTEAKKAIKKTTKELQKAIVDAFSKTLLGVDEDKAGAYVVAPASLVAYLEKPNYTVNNPELNVANSFIYDLVRNKATAGNAEYLAPNEIKIKMRPAITKELNNVATSIAMATMSAYVNHANSASLATDTNALAKLALVKDPKLIPTSANTAILKHFYAKGLQFNAMTEGANIGKYIYNQLGITATDQATEGVPEMLHSALGNMALHLLSSTGVLKLQHVTANYLLEATASAGISAKNVNVTPDKDSTQKYLYTYFSHNEDSKELYTSLFPEGVNPSRVLSPVDYTHILPLINTDVEGSEGHIAITQQREDIKNNPNIPENVKAGLLATLEREHYINADHYGVYQQIFNAVKAKNPKQRKDTLIKLFGLPTDKDLKAMHITQATSEEISRDGHIQHFEDLAQLGEEVLTGEKPFHIVPNYLSNGRHSYLNQVANPQTSKVARSLITFKEDEGVDSFTIPTDLRTTTDVRELIYYKDRLSPYGRFLVSIAERAEEMPLDVGAVADGKDITKTGYLIEYLEQVHNRYIKEDSIGEHIAYAIDDLISGVDTTNSLTIISKEVKEMGMKAESFQALLEIRRLHEALRNADEGQEDVEFTSTLTTGSDGVTSGTAISNTVMGTALGDIQTLLAIGLIPKGEEFANVSGYRDIRRLSYKDIYEIYANNMNKTSMATANILNIDKESSFAQNVYPTLTKVARALGKLVGTPFGYSAGLFSIAFKTGKEITDNYVSHELLAGIDMATGRVSTKDLVTKLSKDLEDGNTLGNVVSLAYDLHNLTQAHRYSAEIDRPQADGSTKAVKGMYSHERKRITIQLLQEDYLNTEKGRENLDKVMKHIHTLVDPSLFTSEVQTGRTLTYTSINSDELVSVEGSDSSVYEQIAKRIIREKLAKDRFTHSENISDEDVNEAYAKHMENVEKAVNNYGVKQQTTQTGQTTPDISPEQAQELGLTDGSSAYLDMLAQDMLAHSEETTEEATPSNAIADGDKQLYTNVLSVLDLFANSHANYLGLAGVGSDSFVNKDGFARIKKKENRVSLEKVKQGLVNKLETDKNATNVAREYVLPASVSAMLTTAFTGVFGISNYKAVMNYNEDFVRVRDALQHMNSTIYKLGDAYSTTYLGILRNATDNLVKERTKDEKNVLKGLSSLPAKALNGFTNSLAKQYAIPTAGSYLSGDPSTGALSISKQSVLNIYPALKQTQLTLGDGYSTKFVKAFDSIDSKEPIDVSPSSGKSRVSQIFYPFLRATNHIGLAAITNKIHSIDGVIAVNTVSDYKAMNMHDSAMGNFNITGDIALHQNKEYFDVTLKYHIGLSQLEGLNEILRLNLESYHHLKDNEEALGKFKAGLADLRKVAEHLYGTAEQVGTLIQADRDKFAILENTKAIAQYAGDDGAFHLGDKYYEQIKQERKNYEVKMKQELDKLHNYMNELNAVQPRQGAKDKPKVTALNDMFTDVAKGKPQVFKVADLVDNLTKHYDVNQNSNISTDLLKTGNGGLGIYTGRQLTQLIDTLSKATGVESVEIALPETKSKYVTGVYDSDTKAITIYLPSLTKLSTAVKVNDFTVTLAHELAHATTVDSISEAVALENKGTKSSALRALASALQQVIKITSEEDLETYFASLNVIRGDANAYTKADLANLNSADFFKKALAEDGVLIKEFIAYAYSHPKMRSILEANNMQVSSAELKQIKQDLGKNSVLPNLFKRIMNALTHLIKRKLSSGKVKGTEDTFKVDMFSYVMAYSGNFVAGKDTSTSTNNRVNKAESTKFYSKHAKVTSDVDSMTTEDLIENLDTSSLSERFVSDIKQIINGHLKTLNVRDKTWYREGRLLTQLSAKAAGFKATDFEHIMTAMVEKTFTQIKDHTLLPDVTLDMRNAYERALQVVKVKDFFDGDWKTATKEQKERALAKYNYLFGIGEKSATYAKKLARFSAMAVANQEVNNILARVERVKKDKNMTISQRILYGLDRFNDFFRKNSNKRNLASFITKLQKEYSKLDSVMRSQERRRRLYDFFKPLGKKVQPMTENAIKTAVKTVSNTLRATKSTTAKNIAKTIEGVHKHGVEAYARAYSDILEVGNKDKLLSTAEHFLNEVVPNTAFYRTAERLLAETKLLEAHRERVYENTANTLLEQFKKEPTGKERQVMERTILRADLTSLFTGDINQIAKYLKDDDAVAEVIEELSKKVNDDKMVWKAQILGNYLVTGRGYRGLELTIAGIVGQDSKVAEEVDKLATLYAILYTPKADKEVLTNLIENDPKGVKAIFNYVNKLREEQKLHSADTDKGFLPKGYAPEFISPYISKVIISPDKVAEYEDKGYEVIARIDPDPLDPITEQRVVMLSSDTGGSRYLSGAVNMVTDGIVQGNLDIVLNKASAEAYLKYEDQAYKDWLNNREHLEEINVVPYYAEDGIKTIGFKYILTEEEKHQFLDKREDVIHNIAYTQANLEDRKGANEHNDTIADAIINFYEENFAKKPQSFIAVSGKHAEAKVREVYAKMPPKMREKLESYFGRGRAIYMDRKSIDAMLGYSKLAIAELMERDPESLGFWQSKFVDMLNAMGFKQHVVASTSRYWGELVKFIKHAIVIRSFTTMMFNIIANTQVLLISGVHPVDAVKNTLLAIKHAHRYQKDLNELEKLRVQRQAKSISQKFYASRVDAMLDSLMSNPLREFMDEGMLSTVVEDLTFDNKQFQYDSPIKRKLEKLTKNWNKKLKKYGNELLANEGSKVEKTMRFATTMSDFSARYVLYKHKTEVGGMSHDEAIDLVRDTFINYDIPTSPLVQYMNDNGWLLFTKFAFRYQRVLLGLIRNHPMATTLHSMFLSLISDIPTVFEPNFLNNIGNPFESGAFGLPQAASQIYSIAMIK